MSTADLSATVSGGGPSLGAPSRFFTMIFLIVLGIGAIYVAQQIVQDLSTAPMPEQTTWVPFGLLGLALLIALGFEFVNGFHDTANAVATVIYTHAMPAQLAVVWSGIFNFLGVMASSGAVAYSIVSLLPVELILKVGSSAGFAMVFALLIAAIIWNLGTWYMGLPSSSSHTLIGSIIGVGLMNQLLASSTSGTSGVDWSQAASIGQALLFSPLVGFLLAAVLLLALKRIVSNPHLYEEPKGNQPPPPLIRGLLVLTCTLVSFAHGSNDGQKGMGLIMLILIGTVPTAFALNHAVGEQAVQAFVQTSRSAVEVFDRAAGGASAPQDPRSAVEDAVAARSVTAETMAAVAAVAREVEASVVTYGSLAKVPTEQVTNVRNDMYLIDETLRLAQKQQPSPFPADALATVSAYKAGLDEATKFIPTWVKVSVALALGLGTMVGWRRIVITVGERIGKTHLTYGQGASAELVAAGTIFAADHFGLPVSTTHVLSSGVAGTMAANGSGLQWGTIRNIAMAWLLTLPASIALAGSLFWLFRTLFAV
ncbi:inorganic phosphate transporter [Marinivivus vitaminiproducens]|uniref:inorganic phosphate transporter n=1 Tax=Marinivivus vitaminiproducens TaxID=3035935 RepID=UPI0027A2D37C|nr:inorganic phosphate transporter [Geminicoccaceae bacterium SCSIO 64248]